MSRLSSRAGIVTIALLSILTASLAVVVAVDSGGGPATASSTTTHTITVSGDGTGYGVPDTLVANLTVHSRQSSAQAAINSVAVNMSHVQSTLKGRGIQKSELQTTDLELNPAYDNHSHVIGYDASESLSVRLPLKRGGNLLSAVTSAVGNAVSFDGISLDISDKSKALDAARTNAFEQAKEAAQTDARLAGETLGKVVSIRETTQMSSPPQPYEANGLAFAAAPKALPISAGKQSVTVTLAVVWAID